MKDLYTIATEIARQGHAGQFRKDGQEYITHPIAVSNLIDIKYIPATITIGGRTSKEYLKDKVRYLNIARVIAVAHDLGEDTSINERSFVSLLQSLSGELTLTESDIIYEALVVLNKNNYQDYLSYIIKIKSNPWARTVKIADLKHNLSDLQKGSLKDKYLLALHILTS